MQSLQLTRTSSEVSKLNRMHQDRGLMGFGTRETNERGNFDHLQHLYLVKKKKEIWTKIIKIAMFPHVPSGPCRLGKKV